MCIISIEIASEYSYVEASFYCHVDTVTRKNKETLHKKQIFNWQADLADFREKKVSWTSTFCINLVNIRQYMENTVFIS